MHSKPKGTDRPAWLALKWARGVALTLGACALLLSMPGCDLPSSDGPESEPRNVLLRFLSDWSNQNAKGLQRSLCVSDQKILRRIEVQVQDLTTLSKDNATPLPLEDFSTSKLILAVLGPPPSPDDINTRLRIALMRTEPTKSQNGLILAGWRLKAHGSGYRVCLQKKGRVPLLEIEQSLTKLETKLKQHMDGNKVRARAP